MLVNLVIVILMMTPGCSGRRFRGALWLDRTRVDRRLADAGLRRLVVKRVLDASCRLTRTLRVDTEWFLFVTRAAIVMQRLRDDVMSDVS